jgi:ATP-dependent exoDNAse (exonuclease V) alpha subunit
MREIEIKVIEINKLSYEELDRELRIKLIRELLDELNSELNVELHNELIRGYKNNIIMINYIGS